jgi:hypothetical protein
MARAVGFEPTTNRLTADCSTAELRPNKLRGSGRRERAYLVSSAGRVNTVKRASASPALDEVREQAGAGHPVGPLQPVFNVYDDMRPGIRHPEISHSQNGG